MVTLLFTAVAILLLLGIGAYFWQKPSESNPAELLPPPTNARGLFADEYSTAVDDAEYQALWARRREELIKQAKDGKRETLVEAHMTGDLDLYDRVLDELVEFADSEPRLLSLLSYISQNQLPVNRGLAGAVLASWKAAPDRGNTTRALHLAALTDEPDIYRGAVESALDLWRAGKLGDISTIELRALFDGEFWVLSSRSRSSGAGFVLKRTLDGARRELETTPGAVQ